MGDSDEEKFEVEVLDVDEKVQNAKGNMIFRLKKKLLTKTALTKMGRKIITQALGEEGNRLFSGLIKAFSMHYGSKPAKEIEKDALIIILKIKASFDHGLLEIKKFRESEELIHSLLFEIKNNLESEVFEQKERIIINPNHLANMVAELLKSWKPLFKPLMQEKNLDKFVNLLQKFGNSEWLYALFNDDKFKKSKQELAISFKILMESAHFRDPRIERTCRFANCTLTAVHSQGFFKSAGFCAAHHLEHYKYIIKEPLLQHFMYEEEQDAVFFLDFLKEKGNSHEVKQDGDPMVYYHFLMTVNQWRTISSKPMRLRRAKIICNKFIRDEKSGSYLNLPIKVRDSFVKEMDSKDSNSPRLPFDFFAEVHKCAMNLMAEYFKLFLQSKQFERFLAACTLPEAEVKILKKSMEFRKQRK